MGCRGQMSAELLPLPSPPKLHFIEDRSVPVDLRDVIYTVDSFLFILLVWNWSLRWYFYIQKERVIFLGKVNQISPLCLQCPSGFRCSQYNCTVTSTGLHSCWSHTCSVYLSSHCLFVHWSPVTLTLLFFLEQAKLDSASKPLSLLFLLPRMLFLARSLYGCLYLKNQVSAGHSMYTSVYEQAAHLLLRITWQLFPRCAQGLKTSCYLIVHRWHKA